MGSARHRSSQRSNKLLSRFRISETQSPSLSSRISTSFDRTHDQSHFPSTPGNPPSLLNSIAKMSSQSGEHRNQSEGNYLTQRRGIPYGAFQLPEIQCNLETYRNGR